MSGTPPTVIEVNIAIWLALVGWNLLLRIKKLEKRIKALEVDSEALHDR
jgi:hypothetical protein